MGGWVGGLALGDARPGPGRGIHEVLYVSTSGYLPEMELKILLLWLYLLWRYSPEMALEMEPILMSVVGPGLAATPSIAATPPWPMTPMTPPWAARAGVSGPWK